MTLAAGQPLLVALHDEAPGARAVMADGVAQLEWTAQAVADGRRLSPLYYPPEPGLQAARTREFDGLHGFLADSLPEEWGSIAHAAAACRTRRGHGAPVRARPARAGRRSWSRKPDLCARDHASRKSGCHRPRRAGRGIAGDPAGGGGEGGTLGDLLADLGGASGGARPKVHVGFGPDGAIGIGDGELPPGHAAWIVKFRSSADPVDIGPVQQAYAMMAREAGLTIGETRLIPARAGPPWFAARRFDRPGAGRRVHMVSLAGAIEAPPQVAGAIDYDMFLRATRAITRDEEDVVAVFTRMVFNVLAGNRDDHSRQHAYLMDDAGNWHLAPAYDLTFSDGPGGEHYLAVAGEGAMPTRGHVDRVAKLHGIAPKRVAAIVEQVGHAVAGWDTAARDAGVSRDTTALVAARLATIRTGFAE